MTGPEKRAAARRGHLRAGDADRERVIEILKAAFVQGRMNRDELDSRVGQVFASRTYAELAALTADLPAGQADTGPPDTGPPDTGPPDTGRIAAGQSSTPARTLATAARRAGLCLLAALALVGITALTKMQFFAALAYFGGIAAVIAASGFLGYGVVDAWQERRSGGQLPPRPRWTPTRPGWNWSMSSTGPSSLATSRCPSSPASELSENPALLRSAYLLRGSADQPPP